MPGISGVLNIAKESLIAQQSAMEVIGQNVSNVNTPGYTRQKAMFESSAPLSAGRIKIGMGVRIDSIIQYTDQITTRAINQKTSSMGEYEAKTFTLSRMETIFNEANDQGLSQLMNEFWNAWQDVANNPGGTPERTALLEKAEILSTRFNAMSDELTQIKKSMGINLETSVTELNSVVREIAQLNEKIVAAESSRTPANDLRDHRASLIEKLSSLVDTTHLENKDGSVTIMTSDGLLLVEAYQSWELSVSGDEIHWNGIDSDVSTRLKGGKIGAYLDVRDDIVPQYQTNLDELAGSLIAEVNGLHSTGYTLSGDRGKTFFKPFKTLPGETPSATDYHQAAAYIQLSDDVKNTPANIAAGGTSGAPGDNGNALKIAAVQGDDTVEIRKWTYQDRGTNASNTLQTETMDDYYRALTADVGILSGEMNKDRDFTQSMLDNLNNLRDSVSGVNLDEELTELIKIQRAYEASSKLIAVANEMLESLMQIR
jgi:flagellar hook-associated protein 1